MNRAQAQRQKRIVKVMPEIKRLVKKYGRKDVAYCLGRIRAYEKELKQLNELKREVSRLEKKL